MVSAVGCLIFFLTLLRFSLADFSRSRLEEICRSHQQIDRFGRILQNAEKSLFLSELLLLLILLISAAVASVNNAFDRFGLPPESSPLQIAAWTVEVIAVLIASGAGVCHAALDDRPCRW
ncbi:MAG: hypothetical protein R3C49_25115 [Planctomycetaceae bacterium]